MDIADSIDMTPTAQIGINIKTLRKLKKLTVKELAKRCGLSMIGIQNMEAGRRKPVDENMVAIATALGVDWETLMTLHRQTTEIRFPVPTIFDALHILNDYVSNRTKQAAPTHGADTPLILLVDDEEVIRDLIPKKLAEHGYRCVTAANGKIALDMLKKLHVQIVISDNRMPHVSGMRLLQIMKSEHSNICRIFATSSDIGDNMMADLAPHHFIEKPYDIEQLLEAIHKGWQAFLNEGMSKVD